MIKNKFIVLGLVIFTLGCAVKNLSNNPIDTWIDLFNGKDLSGWTTKVHHYATGVNYGETFRVLDGMVSVRYDKYEGILTIDMPTYIMIFLTAILN